MLDAMVFTYPTSLNHKNRIFSSVRTINPGHNVNDSKNSYFRYNNKQANKTIEPIGSESPTHQKINILEGGVLLRFLLSQREEWKKEYFVVIGWANQYNVCRHLTHIHTWEEQNRDTTILPTNEWKRLQASSNAIDSHILFM